MSTTATKAETAAPKPGHLQERQDALEQRLNELVQRREVAQAEVKKCGDELNKLFRDCPSRPNETLAEIEERIKKLERERTIVSMALTKEKAILKQIHKLERSKTKVNEFLAFNEKIKAKKEESAEKRKALGELNSEISTVRLELSNVKTANQLGCQVEELLGMKVPCPKDKIGQVIGKKGKNLQQLSQKANVTVDLDYRDKTEDGDLRIVGPISALDSAIQDLERVMSTTEETLSVSPEFVQFLTSKGITTLNAFRQSHPDVNFDVTRNKTDIKMRGIPADLETFKDDLLDAAARIETQFLAVTSKEASFVVGKQGATVESIVNSHQVAVDVSRDEGDETKSKITITGPSGHVQAALRDIQDILDANRESERTVPIDSYVKTALLMQSGKGIQSVFQKVNEAVDDKSAGFVSVNFLNNDIMVKGKNRVLDVAVEAVQAELRRLEDFVVKFKVDPAVIPVFIGKGGQGVKALKGERIVNIEFERETGQVIICGLNEEDVKAVAEQAKALAAGQIVERITLDPAQYKYQIRELIRTKAKELNALVHMNGDDEKMQVVLRGSRENLDKAGEIVKEFLEHNYIGELEVTGEDITALLSGGKSSKIVELAGETGVNLSSERDRQAIVAKGEKDKVLDALKKVKLFLYGGEGMTLVKIPVDKEVLGMVIGKGGKNKADLEKKYTSLSIIVHRQDDVITLRGAEEEVAACRLEILKQVATARVTEKLTMADKGAQSIEKSGAHRRIMRTIPVQISIEGSNVTVRGLKDDVRDAVAALEEEIGKPYQAFYYLDKSLFRRVRDSWRDGATIKRIEKVSGAKMVVSEEKFAITFSGKRDDVKKAKIEALKYLEFVLASNFCLLHVPGPLLVSLSKSGCVSDVVAISGAQLLLDRDVQAVLIFSLDPPQVQKAKEAMLARIDRENKLVYVLQLDETEDWLVASILGKNGARINALRKQTNCRIEVDSHEKRLKLSADDEEVLNQGKITLHEFIDTERKGCVVVTIPSNHLPAFIGRSGTHIKEFSTEHGVEVQLSKKGTSTVRLTGDDDAVEAAKNAITEWIAVREGRQQEEQASVSITLKKDQIPRVIGQKGSVIRSLERTFGCKIDVDKKTSIVTVRGSKRAEAREKIIKIANEEETDELLEAEHGETVGEESLKEDAEGKASIEKENEPKEKVKPEKSAVADPAPPTVERKPVGPSDFPALVSNGDSKSAGKVEVSAGTSSWASMLKGQNSH